MNIFPPPVASLAFLCSQKPISFVQVNFFSLALAFSDSVVLRSMNLQIIINLMIIIMITIKISYTYSLFAIRTCSSSPFELCKDRKLKRFHCQIEEAFKQLDRFEFEQRSEPQDEVEIGR